MQDPSNVTNSEALALLVALILAPVVFVIALIKDKSPEWVRGGK